MPAGVGSLSGLREHNRLMVLEAVQSRRADSRIGIARMTGLSQTTVGSLVAELITAERLVEVAGPTVSARHSRVGRPATTLALHPDSGFVVGVHLGHDGVRIALADLNGKVVHETFREGDVDRQVEDSLAYVVSSIEGLAESQPGCLPKVQGIGVAVSAPVHLRSHALRSPSLLAEWDGIDLTTRLESLTGLPVQVGNDANLGALAEWKFGAGRDVDDLLYVMLSEGVGAGLILDGRLYEGSTGTAGELGHVTLEEHGHICRCGNRGCLETLAGSRAVIDALAHSRETPTTLQDVLDLVAERNPGATRAVVDAGRSLGRALAGFIPVLDPRLVVVGGQIAAAGEPLMAGIKEVLARSLSPRGDRPTQIVLGELGDRAEVLGAIAVAIAAGSRLA